jgi:hypothetical protein
MAFNYSPKIITDGLVLYLDAANPKSYVSGSTIWNDLSRGGNNGTLVNGPTFNSGNGGSLVFDGVDDYVNGNLNSLSAGASCTIEALIKLNNISGTKAIFSHGRSGFSFNSGMVIVNNNLRFRNTSNDHGLSTPTSLTINQWYHLVLSSNSLGTTGYCNGISQGNTVQTLTNNSINDYHISRRSSNAASEFMNGNIAFIKIYQNKSLNNIEILQNYNATKTRYGL